MRVRGLKLTNVARLALCEVSHPMRVRGLKPLIIKFFAGISYVAPHAGAWIETLNNKIGIYRHNMSHPMRVRGLKHPPYFVNLINNIVAPHVGVWIETEF